MKKLRIKDGFTDFLLYTSPNGKVKIEVILNEETVWLTQKAISALFGVQVPAISKHIDNIYESGELQGRQLFPFWKQFKPKATGK
jgi:hypothetical protein